MKKRWIIWGIGAALYICGLLCHTLTEQPWLPAAVFALAWITVGWKVAWKALRNIARGQVFDENFLMLVASVGAFIIGEAAEGAAVMLFYQLGELFESMAVARSRRSVTELMSIRPDTATVLRDGQSVVVEPEEVAEGETILVAAGEKIPLDGVILSGSSSLDTAALTGESLPRDVMPGDTVQSGCVNGSGLLTIQVTGTYAQSTVARILDMVENAASMKSRSESFITRFAAVYTPVVVCLALVVAVLPPLVIPGAVWSEWIYRALEFLVVSCPCALVISVPLSFFGGIGGASRSGILVKGSGSLEALASTRIAVFDKTGTLTEGAFHVVRTVPAEGWQAEELLYYAAHAEAWSSHPAAQSLRNAYGRPVEKDSVTDVTEEAGYGVSALVYGHRVLAGNLRLMERHGISCRAADTEPGESPVYAAVDGVFAGWIAVSDRIRDDAQALMRDLRKAGFRKTVMLTGDRADAGERIGRMLEMDEIRGGLLPGDKVAAVEELLAGKRPGETLVYLGDGINDAPVLARADVGAAMGGLGSDAAMEAADIVIMTDAPSRLAAAVQIARKTMGIVRQNIVFAIGVKVLVMLCSVLGYANMWMAVFADVGVSVLAIANALRCMKKR